MKSLLILLALFSTATPQVLCGQSTGAELTADAEMKRIVTTTTRLCHAYFVKRYQMMGAELKSSITLEAPEEVQGWTGRYRMQGRATLRNYKLNADNSAREEALRRDPNLSGKEIRRLIDGDRLMKSEIVEFEVIVMDLGTKPSIDVTLR